ncbi:hypothetical protein ONS95_013585 [Cadophora gregata]|uniref:uncharacterized protein n=1 Tax=Cadophora gregata TaxID=51156 RepID=UPI0026DB0652|nr:uncharacterized protein ONS95_013585 [Cadophora gregata]KAK0113329.1 hypothetical protein ONS96_014194 [Cadophora gregata f. sp. sojae]KAK0114080.1 hypothetical protein ONS95_013585 [Cadophora gregata]
MGENENENMEAENEKMEVENDTKKEIGTGENEGTEGGGEEKGYFWTVFKLERCHGQNDIDTSRPTQAEKRDYALVEAGF